MEFKPSSCSQSNVDQDALEELQNQELEDEDNGGDCNGALSGITLNQLGYSPSNGLYQITSTPFVLDTDLGTSCKLLPLQILLPPFFMLWFYLYDPFTFFQMRHINLPRFSLPQPWRLIVPNIP